MVERGLSPVATWAAGRTLGTPRRSSAAARHSRHHRCPLSACLPPGCACRCTLANAVKKLLEENSLPHLLFVPLASPLLCCTPLLFARASTALLPTRKKKLLEEANLPHAFPLPPLPPLLTAC